MAIHGWNQYYRVKKELQRTPKALLLLVDVGDEERAVWLPRKVISLQLYDDRATGKDWQVGVPEWLCEKLGLN